MNSSWKIHLESKGAVIENNKVIHFGKAEQELNGFNSNKTTIIADLSHYALIKISGSEAQSFLQSQFSNDVDLINESQAQLNSYCSPKGRILALFSLFKINNDFYLQLPHDLLDSILKRLTMFKMRADVELEDVSDSIQCIGISGLNAESLIQKIVTNVPNSHYSSITQNGITVIRLENATQQNYQTRFIIFANNEILTQFWNDNNQDLLPVSSNIWSLLDIQSGIPTIETATIDSFVPQMVNLQLINAVSFKKGCYPGQEIVARTQYLGKLKKRMYLLKSENDQQLLAGSDLTTENATDEQSKGKIVNCQLSPDGGIEALAVIQISSIDPSNEQGAILLKQNPQIKFTIHELPYSFESTESQ